MKPSVLEACVDAAFNLKSPTMIWGAPGIGKSRIISDYTKKVDIGLVDIRLSTYDPTDLKGIPAIVDGTTTWLSLGELPDVIRDGTEGILFLDEINAAPPATSAAAYRLILDRKIGNYTLPDGWNIVAAGNRESDKGVTYKMPAPLANRFTHLELEPDLTDWFNWALKNRISANTISFIRFKPDHLNRFDPTQRAFPTPRMWEVADKYSQLSDPVTRSALIRGAVGDGAGIEFDAFVRMANSLPDPDLIIMNPDDAKVPEGLDVLHATVGALAHRATPMNFDRILRYADRLRKEFQVYLIRDAAKRTPEVANTDAFNMWSAKNASVLI